MIAVLLLLPIVTLLPEVGPARSGVHIIVAICTNIQPIMQPSSAAFVLSVRLYTYRNKEHKDSDGYCCESYSKKRCKDNCDNIFTFCLRGANIRDDNVRNCPLQVGNNQFSFYSDNIKFRQNFIRDRIFYSYQPWPVSETLLHDYDLILCNNFGIII